MVETSGIPASSCLQVIPIHKEVQYTQFKAKNMQIISRTFYFIKKNYKDKSISKLTGIFENLNSLKNV